MKKLNERRDELAKEYAYPDGPPKGRTCQFALERGYVDGFSAAIAELMPQVNKLVEALNRAKFDLEMAIESKTGINVVAPKQIDETLAEWQEFIGDEK